MPDSRNRTALLRALLLTTSAVASIGLTSVAQAQDTRNPDLVQTGPTPHAGVAAGATNPGAEPYAQDRIGAVTPPVEQILISNPGTPTTARDPNNVTGIGQMIVSSGGGSLGLCTGSLINPRTVLFAAHCVNGRAATDYGSGSGGVPIAFGFEAFLRNEAAGRPDELGQWFFAGPNQFKTNVGSSFFTVNQVRYNTFSLEPEARSFLYGDVATATLDTPAAGIPTWAVLFSALPTPTITAGGTGYNVQIAGYGSIGTGATGQTGGSDFRRRVAENVLGALTDLNQFETFLFGSSTSPTQNLYFIDFDDPRRGLGGASPFDFNAFRDNARGAGTANPTEGTTAPGDSGGPLILQNFGGRQLIAGVLSGGYARFFNGQPQNGYGSVSFYQPLHLYWDWIAANNPYRYVTNIAGDRNWTDATNWVSVNDPNYFIINASGQVVNGVPTAPGEQKSGTTGDFGEICFQTATTSECRNAQTGQERFEGRPIGTDEVAVAADNAGTIDVAAIERGTQGWAEDISAQPQADASPAALPPATIANGLPGATNFVPSNVDPNRLAGTIGRYYDVTLTANGTTTLNSAVTIDRFQINGSGARLNITSTGSFTSLIDVRQLAGVTTVNGTLTSVGDFTLAGGGLMGSGRINAPFTTNIMATITPGTDTTIGTLTFGGNLVLASGSQYFVNVGGNGNSDRIAVVATTFNAANQPTNGSANLGGRVSFSPTAGNIIRFGDVYTILTAQGGITGRFATPTAISAILTPELTYSNTTVQARINAGLFANVIDGNSPIQSSFARLLDQNRSQYSQFSDLFGELDLQNQATIRSQLEGFAPHAQNAGAMQSIVATDTTSRFIRNRMLGSGQHNAGGTIAMYGKPVELASLATSNLASDVQSDVGTGMSVQQGVLPDSVAVYLAGGYIDGKGVGLPTATPTGRGDFDGYFIAAGVEAFPDDVSTLGFAMTYSDLDGNTALPTQSASSQLVQGTLYGTRNLGRLTLDAMVSAGVFEVDTNRQVAVGAASFDLNATDRAFAFQSEAGVGFDAGVGGFSLTPRASARFSRIEFTDTVERGGGPALQYDLGTFDSFQGRAGATAKVTTGAFRPYVTANYVHEFEDRPAFFGTNFRGGVGPQALIALPGTDRDWAEVSGGVAFGTDRVSFAVEAETTIERKDVSNQAYKGTVTLRF